MQEGTLTISDTTLEAVKIGTFHKMFELLQDYEKTKE